MRRQIVPLNSGIMLYGLCLIIASLFFTPSQAALNELSPNNTQCACSGDVLTFTCTIVGGGNTLWRGSAFDCESTSDEIILRHSTFGTTGTSGTCNSGTIVGQSVGVEDTCFTSRLNVTVSESLNSRAVQCDHNSNTGTRNIGSAILNVVSASNPYPPPNDVSLISTNQRQVTFNWTSVSSSCPTIDYVITSDCGVCPSSTNSTTVTCSDLQLPTRSDDSVCSFSVSSRVCGVVGNQTTTILTASVPNVPQVIIIPLYSNESQSLKRLSLNITINHTIIITNDVSGPITDYSVTYLEQFNVIQSSLVESEPCDDDVCNFMFEKSVPSSICSSSSDINATVSATNRIGQGLSSEILTIGCTNDFVQLDFNSSNSVFFCTFLSEDSDPVKSCIIDYGLCDQQTTLTLQGYSTSENLNSVELDLQDLTDGTYCYLVTAKSVMTAIQVEGNFIKTGSGSFGRPRLNILVISLGVVIPIVSLLLLVILVVFVIISKKRRLQVKTKEERPMRETDPYKKLKLTPITGRKLETHQIKQSCALREMVTQIPGVKNWRGNAFYQLTNEEEDITDDKELILQNKNTNEYFNPGVDSKTICKLGLCGERITKGRYGDDYIIFVQSKGSGARHLAAGTFLLYDHDEKEKVKDDLLWSIPKEYFVMKEVEEDGIKLKQFCESHNFHLDKNKLNLYLEFDSSFKDHLEKNVKCDVLLMDPTGELFTSPNAQPNHPESGTGVDQKWRYFVRSKYDEELALKRNKMVLFENPEYVNILFHVLEVNEENVRMSEFVKRKLKISSFERGRAFYEFTLKEDLPYCRKVVRMTKNTTTSPKSQETYKATARAFFDIPGAPGMGISPPHKQLDHTRLLLQCTSLGSRCLKKGTFLLYSSKDLCYDNRVQLRKTNDLTTVDTVHVPVHHNTEKKKSDAVITDPANEHGNIEQGPIKDAAVNNTAAGPRKKVMKKGETVTSV